MTGRSSAGRGVKRAVVPGPRGGWAIRGAHHTVRGRLQPLLARPVEMETPPPWSAHSEPGGLSATAGLQTTMSRDVMVCPAVDTPGYFDVELDESLERSQGGNWCTLR